MKTLIERFEGHIDEAKEMMTPDEFHTWVRKKLGGSYKVEFSGSNPGHGRVHKGGKELGEFELSGDALKRRSAFNIRPRGWSPSKARGLDGLLKAIKGMG